MVLSWLLCKCCTYNPVVETLVLYHKSRKILFTQVHTHTHTHNLKVISLCGMSLVPGLREEKNERREKNSCVT